MARRGDGIYKRGKVWRLDAWINGQRYQISLGKNISRSVAAELASMERAKILRGEYGIGRKKKDLLFDDAAGEFLTWADANKRPKTARSYRSIVKILTPFFGGRKLGEIHPFLIEKYKQQRLADGARVAVNRELSRLRTLFNLHIKWGKFDGANPVSRFQRVPESRGRVRFLTVMEEAQLLERCEDPLRSLVILGIHTGLRAASEGLTLTRPNVDFSLRAVTIEDHFAKNGETRTVPLNSVALETLRHLEATVPGPWVFMTRNGRGKQPDGPKPECFKTLGLDFPAGKAAIRRAYHALLKTVRPEKGGSREAFQKLNRAYEEAMTVDYRPWQQYKSFKTAFATACRRANLPDVTPHTLRHTFASRLVMKGVDLRTVQELGGWKSLSMVQRYAHLSPAHKQQAVELLVGNSPTIFPTPAEIPTEPKSSNLRLVNEMGR